MDILTDSRQVRRLEIVETGRRRRWSAAEKLRIVEEGFSGPRLSEYELSLLRQRGIAARDSKAQRGEYRFMLPPGFFWNELGKIEIDPDEHVAGVVRLVFTKFRELRSARQVFLWLRAADIKMPVVLRNVQIYKLSWKAPAYHTVMQILHNPLYAGAYASGRIAQKTWIVDGRARKVSGPTLGVNRARVLQIMPTMLSPSSTAYCPLTRPV